MDKIINTLLYTLVTRMDEKIDEKLFIPSGILTLSLIMILAWFFDWSTLLSLGDDRVTMKFHTAIAFLMLSAQMLFSLKNKHSISAFFGGMLFISCIWAINSFIQGTPMHFMHRFEEEQFHKESITGDFPNWATLFCFMLASLAVSFNFFRKAFVIMGFVFCIMAITSYLVEPFFELPILRYYVPQYSTAVAFHTAIFMLHVVFWMDARYTKYIDVLKYKR